MIKERYVNFEVANLLRDKGFNEPCRGVYEEKVLRINTLCDWFNSDFSEYVAAPTQAMACDWIEEQYGIFIQINRDNQYYEGREVIAVTKEDKERGHMTMYYARVFDKHSLSNTTEHYDSIESAYNDALKYVLTNLI
jgi:hypothetical protein